MKKLIKNQLSLFDVLAEPPQEPRVAAVPLTMRQLLMEQVMRDRRVLAEGVECHIPDTQFFLDRIAANLLVIKEMNE